MESEKNLNFNHTKHECLDAAVDCCTQYKHNFSERIFFFLEPPLFILAIFLYQTADGFRGQSSSLVLMVSFDHDCLVTSPSHSGFVRLSHLTMLPIPPVDCLKRVFESGFARSKPSYAIRRRKTYRGITRCYWKKFLCLQLYFSIPIAHHIFFLGKACIWVHIRKSFMSAPFHTTTWLQLPRFFSRVSCARRVFVLWTHLTWPKNLPSLSQG